tara:strand:+ start:1350 stop:1553 length:204 start_codon:yes stop_codon:yes gene_type:complete
MNQEDTEKAMDKIMLTKKLSKEKELLKSVYHDLLVLNFDINEYVDHKILKESLDSILEQIELNQKNE